MPIPYPVSKTIISTTQWGIPVTDEVNRLATAELANRPTPWAAVSFLSGWNNYGQGFQTCQYRKIGDVVYLRGLMTGGAMAQFAFVLPSGFRPPARIQIVTQASGAFAWFSIDNAGNMNPENGSPAAYNINCSFSTTA